jgi:anthranilate synthase/aminodeoxychorismate synthase-like glutamine amidotransferase
MIAMIDNYDSFTYNLVQYFGELGAEVRVFRNDEVTCEEVLALSPSHIVISPGPCTPDQAGITLALIAAAAGRVPVLGVCLGHQALVEVYGGSIVRADRLMHGKASKVFHRGAGLYQGLPNPFSAGRYHSLIARRESVPGSFEVTAWTEEGEVMGVRHESLALEGVQFHPESILTPQGPRLLKAFLDCGTTT